MSRPVGQTRVEMKLEGLDLPSLDNRWGVERTKLWQRKFRRKRIQRIKRSQLDQYIPYIMSGIHHSVDFDKRVDAIEPIAQDYKDAVTEQLFTVKGSMKRLREKRREALEQKQQFDKIQAMTSDDFDVEAWIRGEI